MHEKVNTAEHWHSFHAALQDSAWNFLSITTIYHNALVDLLQQRGTF